MIPVGAIGERAPATQPCATMSVIRKGDILARSATTIASGAIERGGRDVSRPDRRHAHGKTEESHRN